MSYCPGRVIAGASSGASGSAVVVAEAAAEVEPVGSGCSEYSADFVAEMSDSGDVVVKSGL